ncbi:hypothetical protein FPZ24_11675 [Sphingomonas panacisoli]|uniref:Uncharacterized protein n=1 Tax=Sphingomonas panacisoli TaxID=1813879 RepID=A0A5B8LJK6_9SPHN|nr:hypothetical protein FPZ24_11675 [Sphingomonas panacisoli]
MPDDTFASPCSDGAAMPAVVGVGVGVAVAPGVGVGVGVGVGSFATAVTPGDPPAPPHADKAKAASKKAQWPDERRARDSMPKNMDEMT